MCNVSLLGANAASDGIYRQVSPDSTRQGLQPSSKNDANDALAICETAYRLGLHFVPVKTVEQQDIKALHSARQFMVEQRTAFVNQMRAFLAESGLIVPAGIQKLQQHLPDILEDDSNNRSCVLRRLLHTLWEEMQNLNTGIHDMDNEIAALSRQQTGY